jgi:hypothetical protein
MNDFIFQILYDKASNAWLCPIFSHSGHNLMTMWWFGSDFCCYYLNFVRESIGKLKRIRNVLWIWHTMSAIYQTSKFPTRKTASIKKKAKTEYQGMSCSTVN